MSMIILFVVFSTATLSVSIRVNYTTEADNGFINKYVDKNSSITNKQPLPRTRFEDDLEPIDDRRQYGLIKFEEHSGQRFRFEDDINQSIPIDDSNRQGIKFQDDVSFNPDNTIGHGDDNKIEGQKTDKKKKRRRRRRKPRYHLNGYPGLQNSGGVYQGLPGQAGYPVNPGLEPQSQGQFPYPYPNAGLAGQYYRPKRPKPSVASQALSAITGALGSIALYDDYQCVPRLLCEAAGGGNLGSGVLQSVGGLQPLLTLLAAYNGISSSPLFVFGRAVLLGMTSKGNTGSCRYAYPQCPTDPEQLVHYLNNHNGGFFRFFNSPPLSSPQFAQQNVQQFYNQLSVPQHYGLYQPSLNPENNYGIYKLPVNPGYTEQNYELDQAENFGPGQQNYGLQQNSNYGFQDPNNLYGNNLVLQNYGPNYPHNKNNRYNKIRFKNNNEAVENNKIQKRILNNPDKQYRDDFNNNDENPKWGFPGNDIHVHIKENNVRGGRALKFPEKDDNTYHKEQNYNIQEDKRNRNDFHFPDSQNSVKYVAYYPELPINYIDKNNANYHSKYTGSASNDYANLPIVSENNYNSDKYTVSDVNYNINDGLQTVYIVRGNSDPNHPEIVKLRPGQSIQ